MKKITTILMLLMLTCMGAKAGEVTTWTTAGSIVTKDALVASAGSGARYAFRMPSNTQPGWCGFNSTTGKVDILDVDHLFTLENSTTGGKYWLKRYSNGEYLSGNNAFSASAGINLTLTARIPDNVTDYDTGYSNSTPFVSFDNDGGGHYNNGNSNYDFRGGTGGWSVYVTYGPFYLVTINCVDEAGDPIPGQAPIVKIATDGSEVSIAAPEITGYTAQAGYQTSVNVNGADEVVSITYAAAAMNYSVVLKDMPDGTNVTIGGTTVANGDTYQTIGAVSESDVAVTYPAGMGYDNETFSVVIEGTTVTIIRGKLISIGAATGKFYNGTTEKPITSGNQYLNKWVSTTTAPSLTLSCQAGNMIINNTYPTETKFNLHTDPQNYTLSTDDGYIVRSYSISAYVTNQGTINGTAVSTDANNPTTVNVEGDGATSLVIANTANPWMYITNFTVLVQAIPSIPVTYIIQEGGQTIYTSDPVLTALGTTVTELPDNLKRNAWYDYEAFSTTVTSETTTITVNATAKENQPVKFTADATSPYYYNMNIRSKYLVYNSTATGEVTLQDTSEPFNPAASWAFVGTPYDGFRLINQDKGTGYNLVYTSVVPGSNHGNNNIQFQTVADAGEKVWLVDTNNSGIVLRMKENQSIYFHHDNGKNFLRTCALGEYPDVHDDAGSTIILTTDKEVLVQLYNVLNEKKDFVGEGLNKYSVSGMTADEFLTLLNNVKSDLDNDNTGNFLNDYNALNAVTIAINQPETGFYRIKGYSGNYITLNTAGRNASMSGEANINNIVCYTPDNQLVFYANGLGMYNTSIVAPLGETLNTYTFLEGAQAGHYYIKSNASDMGTYCFDNTADGSKVDRNGSPVTSGDYQTDWTLEEVTELPITLRSTDNVNYFATFSAPVNVQISGASLNTVTNNNKTAAYNTVDTDMLKAGVGVLLSGTSPTATATIITDEVADANYGLVSYYAATAGTGDESMLYLGKGKTSGKAGFYKLGEGTTSNGFKAYLENSTEFGNEGKEGFELEFAGVTGIDNMENGTLNMENGAVYNLQGQRVNKAQKGVFIQNGKKVVLK